MEECSGRRCRGGARLLALVALLAMPLAAPASAHATLRRASVQIGSSQIVLTTPGGARAIVNRSPFDLTIVNAGGRPVLRESTAAPSPTPPLPVLGGAVGPPTGGALEPPTPVPPASQAEFGTTGPPPPARYAPLSFLVGTQSVSETPAGQWEGTLSSVAESGVEYSAESVLTASAQGDGMNLTLSTNDPSGRQLAVTITPGRRRHHHSQRPTGSSRRRGHHGRFVPVRPQARPSTGLGAVTTASISTGTSSTTGSTRRT